MLLLLFSSGPLTSNVRVSIIPKDDREIRVPPDDRTIIVPKDNRIIYIPNPNSEMEV